MLPGNIPKPVAFVKPMPRVNEESVDSGHIRNNLLATSRQSSLTESISTSVPQPSLFRQSSPLPVVPEVIAPERPIGIEQGRRETVAGLSWFEQNLQKHALLVSCWIKARKRRKCTVFELPPSVGSTESGKGDYGRRESMTSSRITISDYERRLRDAIRTGHVTLRPRYKSFYSVYTPSMTNEHCEVRRQTYGIGTPDNLTPRPSVLPRDWPSMEAAEINNRYDRIKNKRKIDFIRLPTLPEAHLPIEDNVPERNIVPLWDANQVQVAVKDTNSNLSSIANEVGQILINSRDKDGRTNEGSESENGYAGLPKTTEEYLSDIFSRESKYTASQQRLSRYILTLCSRRTKRETSPSLIAVSAIFLAAAITYKDNYAFNVIPAPFHHHNQIEVLTLVMEIAKRVLYIVELLSKNRRISVVDFDGERLTKTDVRNVIEECHVTLLHFKLAIRTISSV